MATVLQPDIHVLKDTPAARYFQRVLHSPDIVTFFCVPTGQWVLAYWINRLGNVVDEIEDLGPAFQSMTPELVDQIRTCWGHVDFNKKKKRILSREKARIVKQQEDVIQDQERWDWLKKRTADKSPVPYVFSPSVEGGEVGMPGFENIG